MKDIQRGYRFILEDSLYQDYMEKGQSMTREMKKAAMVGMCKFRKMLNEGEMSSRKTSPKIEPKPEIRPFCKEIKAGPVWRVKRISDL